MQSKLAKYGALVVLLCTAFQASAGEKGSMLKADELKAEPFRDAKTLNKLSSGEKVEILKKNGGWLEIKTGKAQGWVRMLSVRRGDAKGSSAAGDVAGVAGMVSGRSGTGKVVATTGIRGLNEEELKAAKFDEEQLNKAESYLTSRADARQFAKAAKLTVRQMEYLPEGGK